MSSYFQRILQQIAAAKEKQTDRGETAAAGATASQDEVEKPNAGLSYFQKVLKRVKEKNKRKNVNSSETISNDQEGAGVTTRKQAKLETKEKTISNENEMDFDNVDAAGLDDVHVDDDVQVEQPEPKNQNEEIEVEKSKQMRPSSPVIFDSSTLVAENESLEAFVVKSHFKRQIKFNLEDHLYTLHLKQKQKNPLYLKSVENILEKALTFILDALKKYYPADESNIVYITICQKSLVNPIRSGTYDLQNNSLKSLVNHVMGTFNAFLHSSAEIRLDDSFEIYFKILSNASINYPAHRRKTVPLRQLVGHKTTESKIFLAGGLIDLPTEFPNKKNSLQNKCLLATVIFSFFKHADATKYLQMKKMCYVRTSQVDKNKAGQLLFDEIEKFCLSQNVPIDGPHVLETVLPQLAEHFKIQIHLILSLDGLRHVNKLSYPEGHNLNKYRIYLYLQPSAHILIIDNLKAFFTHNKRRICFDCGKFGQYCYKSNPHQCRTRVNCVRCHGSFKTEETVQVPNEIIYFCDSKTLSENQEVKVCTKCNFTFVSKICFSNHIKGCEQNKLNIKCSFCPVYLPAWSKETHVCGQFPKRCQICFELTTEDFHICKVRKEKIHNLWPNLGFLNMKFKSTSTGNCQDCFLIKKKFMNDNQISYKDLFNHKQFDQLVCSQHHEKTLLSQEEPNLISLFTEQIDRTTFKQEIFKEDSIVVSTKETDLNFEYSQNPLQMSDNVCQEKPSIKNMCSVFYKYLENISWAKTPIDKLFLFLCDKKNNFSNFTFIVENNKTMLCLLRYILKLQVTPFIIQRETNIILLEISGLRMKFVLRTVYLKGTTFEIGSQYGINYRKCFFPDILNLPKNYNFVGSKPDLSTFLKFSTTSKEIAEITFFYENLDSEWNFNDELLKCFQTESLVSAKAMLMFLKESFNLQNVLASLTGKPANAIHPFGGKLISLSGFSFAIFQYYFHNDVDSYTVMNPDVSGRTQSSRGEYEYLGWLNFKGNDFIQSAYNCGSGQKNFGKFYVDGYCQKTKTVYQFKG